MKNHSPHQNLSKVPDEGNLKVFPQGTDHIDVKCSILARTVIPLMVLDLMIWVNPYSSVRLPNLWAAEFLNNDRKVKIEPGDTLSEVLDRRFPNRHWRIWGKNGVLLRIATLNPEISDLDHLWPGQMINIGDLEEHLTEFSSEKPPDLSKQVALVNRVLAAEEMESKVALEATEAENVTEPEDVAEPEETSKPEGSTEKTQTQTQIQMKPPAQVPAQTQACETPHPEAKPSPEVRPELLPSSRYGWMSIDPNFSYSLLTATDKASGAQAVLPSNVNSGVSFQWGQHWSKTFETSLNLGLQQTSYTSQETSGMSLDDPSHLLTQFGLFSEWMPSGKDANGGLSFLSGLEFAQRLFVRGTSLSSDALDAVAIPELRAGLSYQFPELDPFTLSFYGMGLLYLPASTTGYSIESGSGYEGGLNMEEHLSAKTSFSGAFFYSYATQNSSIADQFQKEIGIRFGIHFYFDSQASNKKGEGK